MAKRVRSRGIILLALLVSGLAGLMHEVIWAKFLIALIGNTADSNVVVLSVFMGGLAIGAVLFGKRVDKVKRPLGLYAVLEFLIGGYCLVLPFLLKGATGIYQTVAADYHENTNLTLVLRVVLSVLVVLPPAILMGGTLPILARYLVAEVAQTRKQVASLYALNNIGAVVGSGLAGFYALPVWGIWGALIFASVANLVAGFLVLGVSKQVQSAGESETPDLGAAPEPALSTPSYGPGTYTATLIALFLSGFAAMGYEVMFIRVIALSFGSSTYSFTVMLMCFITGIGLGSLIISMIEVKKPLLWLGVSQLLVVIAFVAVTPLITRLPYYVGLMRVALDGNPYGFELHQASKALLSMAVLLVPTMCIGISFPLVTQVQTRSVNNIGGTVGSTYAWNTAGNMLGILITGQVLLNMGGIARAFEVNLGMSLLAGIVIMSVATEWPAARRLASVGAAVTALIFFAALLGGWQEPINYAFNHLRMRKAPDPSMSADLMAREPSQSFDAWKASFVMDPEEVDGWYHEEDENATVMAMQYVDRAALFINTKPEASCAVSGSDMNTQLMVAHLPMLFNPNAKTLMMIGYGSGVTLGSAMLHPSLERADLAEISYAVLNAHEIFEKYNYDVLNNPKVHAYHDDARSFLRTAPRKYDVIISEPSNPWIAGVSGLFTREFFEESKAKLNENGILCMWFHQYEMSDENVQLVLRTLHDVFGDNVVMFLPDLADVICLASPDPIVPDFKAIEDRFNHPAIREDFAKLRTFNLASILSYHLISSGRLGDFIGEGPVNTDNHQILEYSAPRSLFYADLSTHLQDIEGYSPRPGGGTDSMLELYTEYRAGTGEQMTRSELLLAANHVDSLHGTYSGTPKASRLAKIVRTHVEAAEAGDFGDYAPARGGRPDPEDVQFIEANNRGALLVLMQQIENALPYFLRAVELQPENLGARINLAIGYRALGRFEEAIAQLETAARQSPDELDIQYQMANTYWLAGESAEAKLILEQIVAPDPYNADAQILTLLGDILLEEGNVSTAIGMYQTAVENNVLLLPAAYRLFSLLIQDPANYDRALEALETVIHYNPNDAQLLEFRARIQAAIETGEPIVPEEPPE